MRKGFSVIARNSLRKHFRAIRVAHADRLRSMDAPLILFLNHASWWDPLTCMLLSNALLPARQHYAPMDAVPMARFPFFRKLGLFPIALGTLRGAADFLNISLTVLKDRRNVLWLTPHSRFADARERPVHFAGGLGALLARKRELTVQPIAIEYTYWNERLPEILISIGEPLFITPSDKLSGREWTAVCEERMLLTQDELTQLALARDPAGFTTLLDGETGTGGIYGAWQRLRGRG